MANDERLVYDYCVQLSLNHRVPDALWQEAVNKMGEQAVIDLTVLSGTYVMVSMLLNATQVGIPGGGDISAGSFRTLRHPKTLARLMSIQAPIFKTQTETKFMKLKSHIRRALVLSLCALGSVWVGHATAQDFPSKPITMVMPYAAGGPGDTIYALVCRLDAKDLGPTNCGR